MSASAELQKAVYDRLAADAGVAAIVGTRIYDNVPADAATPYLSFGPSDYAPEDAECVTGRRETLQVDCWTRDQGRLRPARELADAVKTALHDAPLALANAALVEIEVTLVRVLQDPDGITGHGVIQATALIEEA